ncbi:MAG: glycosyltransferase family 9 protein [Lentisphaeria bacterium]
MNADGKGWTVVLRGGALGDFLLTLPLLRGLAAAGERGLLVSRDAYRVLLPPERGPEQFLAMEGGAAAALYGPMPAAPPGAAWSLRGARMLAFQKADAGLAAAWRAAGAALVRWIEPRPAGPLPAAVQFCRDAGVAEPPDWSVAAPLAGGPEADGREPVRTGLWLHPGSGGARKNAPPAQFAQLAAGWRRARGGPVTVSFGEAEDRGFRDAVLAAFAAAGVVPTVAADRSLAELRRGLAGAAGFAGNDSGVAHLAAACGTPVLALFRATDPAVWRPLGPRVAVAAADAPMADLLARLLAVAGGR